MIRIMPQRVLVGLLVAAYWLGCGGAGYGDLPPPPRVISTRSREVKLSVRAPFPLRPPLLGRALKAGGVRVGGGVTWMPLGTEPEDPGMGGVRVVPTGVADGWVSISTGRFFELGASVAVFLPTAQMPAHSPSPFADPAMALAQVTLDGRIFPHWPVGIFVGLGTQEVETVWLRRSCNNGQCSARGGGPGFTWETTFRIGADVHVSLGERVGLVAALGGQVASSARRYRLTTTVCWDDGSCGGTSDHEPTVVQAGAAVVVLGVELILTDWLRGRLTVQPLAYAGDGFVGYLVTGLAVEGVFE